MIIYIEGVDGTGKSTLKDKLTERLEQLKRAQGIIEIIPEGEKLINTHPLKPGRLSKDELFKQLYEMTVDTTKVYICDRGPISDIVYRTFDEYTPVTDLENFWVFWVAHQYIIVCIHCDSDKSEELMKVRGDDNPIAFEKYKELRYLYQQICPMFNPVKYDVGTMGDNMSEVINRILARLWTGRKHWKLMQEQGGRV